MRGRRAPAQSVQAPPAPKTEAAAVVETAPAAASPLPAGIDKALEKALDKKLAPMMRTLAEMQEQKVRLTDVLGGLGYIFGLVGVAAYFKRNRGKGGHLKRICVIDGQGGGIGAAVIKALKEAHGESIELIALGTNAIAAAQMLKAGANRAASGENAIVRTTATADVIIGPMSIGWANAMLGEVTPKMAEAVMSSPAPKIFLPLSQEAVILVGVSAEPLPHLVQQLVQKNSRRCCPMCEANAYWSANGKEDLVLESVDVVEPQPDGGFLLVNIFGQQKTLKAKLKRMNLVDHRVVFETASCRSGNPMISEPFALGNSPLHRCDPRIRLVSAAAYSLVVALSYALPALAAALALSMVLLSVSPGCRSGKFSSAWRSSTGWWCCSGW